jgi:nucleoside-diphosphate-sugar epimerase
MQILLIGGARFLGRYIVDDLAARGHQVTLLNRGNQRPHPAAVAAIRCDKADRRSFGEALLSARWDAVIDTVLSDTELAFTIETLQGRVGRFIHTGSIGVYAPYRRIPARESDVLSEHNAVFNFNAKLRQDQILLAAHHEKGFPGTSLRMSYIYGPGDVPLDGWGGRSREFFRMLRDADKLFLPNDGRALLQPGYVADLARAFGAALECPRSIGEVYNIAGPSALMMRDYVGLIISLLGATPSFEYMPSEDVLAQFPKLTNRRGLLFACEHMCCEITKAERDLQWHPTTQLDVGMSANIAWMKESGII